MYAYVCMYVCMLGKKIHFVNEILSLVCHSPHESTTLTVMALGAIA